MAHFYNCLTKKCSKISRTIGKMHFFHFFFITYFLEKFRKLLISSFFARTQNLFIAMYRRIIKSIPLDCEIWIMPCIDLWNRALFHAIWATWMSFWRLDYLKKNLWNLIFSKTQNISRKNIKKNQKLSQHLSTQGVPTLGPSH